MNILVEILFVAAAYVLGSIPVGFLLTRSAHGLNIMEMGSGNIGSTNVRRVVGRKTSVITQLCDMAKGLLPVLVYSIITNSFFYYTNNFVFALAMASILGHDFSIFLKFKGGKGVNTTLGASVLLAPHAVFISVAIYYLVKWTTGFTSLGSIALALALPTVELFVHGTSPTFYYLLACMLLIIIRHMSNIKRLIKKQELKS